MPDAKFISVDLGKISQFESESQEVIQTFEDIKTRFVEINGTLLGKWKGIGADRYKFLVDNILENVGGIKDTLDEINNGVVMQVRDAYIQLDTELGAFNKNPPQPEGSAVQALAQAGAQVASAVGSQ